MDVLNSDWIVQRILKQTLDHKKENSYSFSSRDPDSRNRVVCLHKGTKLDGVLM